MWLIIKKYFNSLFNIEESAEVMMNISEVMNINLPDNIIILNQSQIPAYCDAGNLIYEKRYKEAIDICEKILKTTPKSSGTHINLMVAYFKIRNENPDNLDKCLQHAKFAMLYGHNTGYAQQRLVISLEKQKKIHQAIQVCDIVISDEYSFSKFGCGTKEEFYKRKTKLVNKIPKSIDNSNFLFFTTEEVSIIFKNIKS